MYIQGHIHACNESACSEMKNPIFICVCPTASFSIFRLKHPFNSSLKLALIAFQRNMEWAWRGEMTPASRNEYEMIRLQLESELVSAINKKIYI